VAVCTIIIALSNVHKQTNNDGSFFKTRITFNNIPTNFGTSSNIIDY